MTAYFAYYRVSTKLQGASGLGLEAQQAAVVSFLKGEQPQGEYVEVASGKKNQYLNCWPRWPRPMPQVGCFRLRSLTDSVATRVLS